MRNERMDFASPTESNIEWEADLALMPEYGHQPE